jgi:hypothetical protein
MSFKFNHQADKTSTSLRHERITVESGVISGESISDGRRSITDDDGEGRRIASESIDIASGQTVSRELAVDFDPEGRATEWAYLDGSSSTRQYQGHKGSVQFSMFFAFGECYVK